MRIMNVAIYSAMPLQHIFQYICTINMRAVYSVQYLPMNIEQWIYRLGIEEVIPFDGEVATGRYHKGFYSRVSRLY